MARHERLRLFVALELPAAACDRLGELIRALRREVPDDMCRWVRPEAIHLTLKFLGETPTERIPALCRALDVAVAGREPVTLQPDAIGSFRGRQGIRAVWMGLQGDTEPVARLVEGIELSIGGLGWKREARPWRAHLTLARVQDRAGRDARRRLGECLQHFAAPVIPAFQIDHVALVASELSPEGSRYQTQYRAPLT